MTDRTTMILRPFWLTLVIGTAHLAIVVGVALEIQSIIGRRLDLGVVIAVAALFETHKWRTHLLAQGEEEK